MKCPFCGELDSKVIDSRPSQEGASIRRRRERPVGLDQLEKIATEIETELHGRIEREVPTSLIGEMVMKRLKDIDEVAYVRFASVYRSFKDIESFMEELNKLLKEPEKRS